MIWEELSRIVNKAGRKVFGLTGTTSHIVLGWNGYIKELYDLSRRSFLTWRQAGTPCNGIVANDMCRRRTIFKVALEQCR